MKIAIVGLGSIGRRHMNNLYTVLENRRIDFSVDLYRNSNKSLELTATEKRNINHVYYASDTIGNNYDVVFVTNPTYLHYETVEKFYYNTRSFFIEKPVFDSTEYKLSPKYTSHDKIFYVACPLRYTPVIQYLRQEVKLGEVFSVRAISSSYLPDWRINQDYRNVYSSYKNMGGGAALDLVHEWDYLVHLFGIPKEVFTFQGKYSGLEINSDDLAIYIARYTDKVIELHLDYFGKNTIRQLELYTDNNVLYADFIKNTILYTGTMQEHIQLPFEDMYINEMNYFFDIIAGFKENWNDLMTSYEVLKIALG